MIVLESNNPEESQIGWFAYVPKNRVNSENRKLVCEHLNNLEILQENTLYLPVIGISQISVSNGLTQFFDHFPRLTFINMSSRMAISPDFALYSSNPSNLVGKVFLCGRSWPQFQLRNKRTPPDFEPFFLEKRPWKSFSTNVLIRGEMNPLHKHKIMPLVHSRTEMTKSSSVSY